MHHALFELVAHHDVQAVGDLVGLGADEGRLRLIDGAVEFLRRVAAQLGEQLAELREHEAREGARAAEQIFIETALALVDAHGDTAVEHRIGEIIRAAGVIERVAALVDNGEHRGGKILLQIVRRDALVKVRTERCRKRMLGRGQADMVQIEAHRAHQVVGKLRLLLLGKMAMQHRIVDLRLFLIFFSFCKNTYIFLANSISTVYNYINMHYQDTRKRICIVRTKTMNSNDILIANTDDLRSEMDYLEKTLLKGHPHRPESL